MDRVTAEKLISIWKRILELFSEANVLARAIPEEKEQTELRHALAQQMASITVDLLLPILRAYPDLDTNEEKPELDPLLSSEEQLLVDQLSAAELEAIDEALLEDACDEWRKVARIVCTALGRLEDRIPGVPDLFYAQRVRKLVAARRLEGQGNLQSMRFSEVRLSRKRDR